MLAFLAIMCMIVVLATFAIELLLLAIVVGIILLLVCFVGTFVLFWIKFMLWLTWPYGLLCLAAIAGLIWLINRKKK